MAKKSNVKKPKIQTVASDSLSEKKAFFDEMDAEISRFFEIVDRQLGATTKSEFASQFSTLFSYLRMHGYPVDTMKLTRSNVHAALEAIRIKRQQDGQSSRRMVVKGTRNDDRDRRIWELRWDGLSWDEIGQVVFKEFGQRRARSTLIRGGKVFAKVHGLEEPPTGHPGRPKQG